MKDLIFVRRSLKNFSILQLFLENSQNKNQALVFVSDREPWRDMVGGRGKEENVRIKMISDLGSGEKVRGNE